MRRANRSMAWSVVAVLCLVSLMCITVATLIEKHEPTITLVSKDWECIAWRPVSLESVETECTVYWRIN